MSNVNAKKELIKHIEDREVELIRIAISKGYGKEPKRIEGTLEQVLPLLNFSYDNGYGGQELFGYIWYTDGTWSERGEYDGSEWWEHKKRPDKDIEIDTY